VEKAMGAKMDGRRRWAEETKGATPPRDGPWADAAGQVAQLAPPRTRKRRKEADKPIGVSDAPASVMRATVAGTGRQQLAPLAPQTPEEVYDRPLSTAELLVKYAKEPKAPSSPWNLQDETGKLSGGTPTGSPRWALLNEVLLSGLQGKRGGPGPRDDA